MKPKTSTPSKVYINGSRLAHNYSSSAAALKTFRLGNPDE